MGAKTTSLGMAAGLVALVANGQTSLENTPISLFLGQAYAQTHLAGQTSYPFPYTPIHVSNGVFLAAPEHHRERGKEVLQDAVDFLLKEFGPPPAESGPWYVIIKGVIGGTTTVIPQRDGSKLTTLDPIFLHATYLGTAVHELHHARYLTDKMFDSLSPHEIEKWATYAQYRYKYRNHDNASIAKIIKDDFFPNGYTEGERKRRASRELHPDLGGPATQQIYSALALELFERPHTQIRANYWRIVDDSRKR